MTTKAGDLIKISTSEKSKWWQVLGLIKPLPEFKRSKTVIIYSGLRVKKVKPNEIKRVKRCN